MLAIWIRLSERSRKKNDIYEIKMADFRSAHKSERIPNSVRVSCAGSRVIGPIPSIIVFTYTHTYMHTRRKG